jgi:hypothetical protein
MSPVSGELSQYLPGGQYGLQDLAWNMASNINHNETFSNPKVSFTPAIEKTISAYGKYAPYQLSLWSGPNYVGTPSSEGLRMQAPFSNDMAQVIKSLMSAQPGSAIITSTDVSQPVITEPSFKSDILVDANRNQYTPLKPVEEIVVNNQLPQVQYTPTKSKSNQNLSYMSDVGSFSGIGRGAPHISITVQNPLAGLSLGKDMNFGNLTNFVKNVNANPVVPAVTRKKRTIKPSAIRNSINIKSIDIKMPQITKPKKHQISFKMPSVPDIHMKSFTATIKKPKIKLYK